MLVVGKAGFSEAGDVLVTPPHEKTWLKRAQGVDKLLEE